MDDVFGIVGTTQSGSFRIERAVAEGGFSVVYRAQHGAFRAPVALKCLKVPGDLTPKERSAYLERFRAEAEISFRLSASIPEVVRPLHVDVLATPSGSFVPFIALEWLEGVTLAELIARRARAGNAPLGAFKLVRMLAPVARALARAHRFPGPGGASLTIVHGDLKPQNLFVATIGNDEVVKILDLGIATAARAAERRAGVHRVRLEGTPWLTPRYAAPEQWEPERFGPVGPWTDVWGLAITMVEALTGRPALAGSREDMRAAALDPTVRPTPRTRGATVADGVERAFQHALAVDPAERARHIEPFWDAIEAALDLPPTFERAAGRRDGSQRRSGALRPLPREEPDEVEEPSRRSVPEVARASMPDGALDRDASRVSSDPPAPAPRTSVSEGVLAVPSPRVVVSGAEPGGFDIPDLAPTSAPPSPTPPEAARDSGLPPVLGVVGGDSKAGAPPSSRSTGAPAVSSPANGGSEAELEQDLLLMPASRPAHGHAPASDPPPPAAGGGHLEVELAVSPASLRPSSPDSARPSRTSGPPSARRKTPRPEPEPRPGLGLPLKIIVAGALLAAADVAIKSFAGVDPQAFFAPLRLLWIGAALVVTGTAVLFWRVV